MEFINFNKKEVINVSIIKVQSLTFGYDGAVKNIFENVSFTIDTDWKLGLIGRNGKGKTTFLNLLLDKYRYTGSIIKNVDFDYFPFEVKNKNRMSIEIVQEIIPNIEDWKIIKELTLMNTGAEILYRDFNTLSGGEQVKILLVSLFLKENNFLLIDEPTNHLDIETRENLIGYLKKKKGFILVSHDRDFLDNVVDHIISINNTNIDIQQGNFTSWNNNKEKQDTFELRKNEKLKKDIKRLEISSKNTANWSNKIEKTKNNKNNSEAMLDKGYIGHQSAKMMKRSKVMERRIERNIEEKSNLLKNIDRSDDLTIKPLYFRKSPAIIATNLQIKYNNKEIFQPVSFEINNGERVAIIGKNGSGKSSILRLIIGNEIDFSGDLRISKDIKISYISQNTENLNGTLKKFAIENNVDEGIFKAMLSKMGVSNTEFEKDIKDLSEGQKKKVLIAKSIAESADIYIWDEPLNYIDILTRMQIERAILKYNPTLIFVEHDKTFVKNIATKIVKLENNTINGRNSF